MTQDARVDRMGANAAPNSDKPKADKRTIRIAGAKGSAAPPSWLRPIADYDRRQPREHEVMRFG